MPLSSTLASKSLPGPPGRRGLVLALALTAWVTAAGCPARRPDATGTAHDPLDIGPPSVLNPTLLDRG